MATETAFPEEIQTLITNLDSQKTLTTNVSSLISKLTSHFSSLQRTLADRSKTLDSALESHDSDTQKTLDSLSLRESSIPDNESTAVAKIISARTAAIAEIESETGPANAQIRTVLPWICRRMDAAELWRYMLANRRDMGYLRREIAGALAESVDPARLVFDALDDFVTTVRDRETEQCWVIAMLLRPLLDKQVSAGNRKRAADVAVKWRERFTERMEMECHGDGDWEYGRTEAQIFLQIVGVFKAKDRFEREYLEKIFMLHGKRKEYAKLGPSLGLDDKVADIIEELCRSGKQMEAIYITHEVGLMDRFPPLQMIESYLEITKERADRFLRRGKNSMASMESASNVEYNGYNAVIRCVEACKLESIFSLAGLRKKVAVIEAHRAEKKKYQMLNPNPNPNPSSYGKRSHPAGSPPPPPARPIKARRDPSYFTRRNQTNVAPRNFGGYDGGAVSASYQQYYGYQQY